MRAAKRILRPERRRQVPPQFSWIDHRLVREHTLEKADVTAWALYLFLVTVADAEGLSYYGDVSIMRRLQLTAERLARARKALITLDLIAYEPPLYQVLSWPEPIPVAAHLAELRAILRGRT